MYVSVRLEGSGSACRKEGRGKRSRGAKEKRLTKKTPRRRRSARRCCTSSGRT